MSGDDSDITPSTSSALHSFAEEDMKASQEHEQVQKLEIEKKLLEIEIQQLENEIATDNAESFSRDQLATVKSELEHNCNELFAQRTNGLLLKLEEAKSEKQVLERKAANLKRALQNEQRLTRQLAEERASSRPQQTISFPELVLPDLSILRDNCALVHRKRALEDEIRDAERQLALRRQTVAENEAKLVKIIQDSKSTTAQCEAQIRAETIELAQLEEMRSSLRERIEANREKQKQLEAEKRLLTSQIEAAELAQRTRIDEINRNFLAAQREFDEVRARKKAEIRSLTKQLHENEELNRAKLQEKEQLIQEINAAMQRRQEALRPQPKVVRKKAKKMKKVKQAQPVTSANIVALQAEIDQLQAAKAELIGKMQELQRKASSNERKLEAVKSKLERKVAESERQVRRLRSLKENGGQGMPPKGFSSDESSSLNEMH
jgi:chromosome segregation ATPase